jgi:hypothetical protein
MRYAVLALAAWVLLAPPDRYRDGASRSDDRAPLWTWTRLGAFADAPSCRRFRDDRVAGARDDVAWAYWSLARCLPAERANGGRLTPDEDAETR